MVAPLLIMAGVAAAGALASAYNSAQANNANAEELQKMKDEFDRIVPPQYNLKITDPPELITKRIEEPRYSSGVNEPKWDLTKFTPETLKVVGKYAPETVPRIMETNPTLIKQSEGMRAGRDAQMQALKKFQQIGEGGFDPEFQEAVQRSKMAAQQEAESRQQSILQDFARRGQSGSGLSLAAQLGGASDSMNRNAMQGLSAASDAYRNRLQALSQGAQLGGQISSQDENLQAQNANIINAFNQRMAAGERAYQEGRANTLNDAQLKNLGMAQEVANANVNARNQASLADRNRFDDITRTNLDLAQSNLSRDDRLKNAAYGRDFDERGYQNNLRTANATWRQNNIDRENQMKGQQYNDLMEKVRGRHGLSSAGMQQRTQQAQDTNAMIGGLTNAGMTYAMGEQAAADKAADREYYGKKRSPYYP